MLLFPHLIILGDRLANLEFSMWVRKEGSWGGKDTFSFNRWWEWARRRLILLTKQICASHICQPKVILGLDTSAAHLPPHPELLPPLVKTCCCAPKSRPCSWEPPIYELLLGGGERKWWESFALGSTQSFRTGGFAYFSPLIYKIVLFTKRALGSSTVRQHLIETQRYKQ